MTGLTGARVLFIDMQEGMVDIVRTQAPSDVRRGARVLANIAEALDLPCLASTIPKDATGGPPLIADLEAIGSVATQQRRSFGPLDHPPTADWAAQGGGALVLAGVLTEGAVFATAMAARQRGLQTHVALEACAGLSQRAEEAAIRQIEAAGAVALSIVSMAAVSAIDPASTAGGTVMHSLRALLV